MQFACLTSRLSRPSYRFRMEQMRPLLAERGHTLTPLLLPKKRWQRLRLFSQLSQYDAVIVQKRTFGWTELKTLRWAARCLVYDLDDAVFLKKAGQPGRSRRRRFAALSTAADLICCGNRFLAEEASRYNRNVRIIPTVIDTDRFCPPAGNQREEKGETACVTLGWTGSSSTSVYLEPLLPMLNRLDASVRLKIISDRLSPAIMQFPFRREFSFVPWSPEKEVPETAGFDIGMMPLPDDAWTRGKCACKALQYMALEVTAVCSPVGINSEIVTDGVNGFLPRTVEEWGRVLTALTQDATLRRRIGRAGRETVQAQFSLAVWGPQLAEALEEAVKKKAGQIAA